MHTLRIPIIKMNESLELPAYFSAGASGMDLAAAIADPLPIAPGETALVPTGFAIAIPEGYEGQIRPRSGLASRHAITVLNAPGTIDSDYRGELKVILINHGKTPFIVEGGMRIAQLIVSSVVHVEWTSAQDALPPSVRSERGFGSSGH